MNCNVNANGLSTTITFEYGTTISYGRTVTDSLSPVEGDSITSVSVDISDLEAGTNYHFRVKAENSCGKVYGIDIEFTSLVCSHVPIVTTLISTNTSSTGETLNGTVNANGLTTTVWFVIEFPKSVGWHERVAVPSVATGDSITHVNYNISHSGPWPFYFKVKAKNSCGVVYGNVLSIPGPPPRP